MSSGSQKSSPQEDYGSITHLCTKLGHPEGASKASGSFSAMAVSFRKAYMGEDELHTFPTSHLDPIAQRCASKFLIKHARLFMDTPLMYPDNVDKLRDGLAKLMCAQQLKFIVNKDYNNSKKRDLEDNNVPVSSKPKKRMRITKKRPRTNPLETADVPQVSQSNSPIDLTQDSPGRDSFPFFGPQTNPNMPEHDSESPGAQHHDKEFPGPPKDIQPNMNQGQSSGVGEAGTATSLNNTSGLPSHLRDSSRTFTYIISMPGQGSNGDDTTPRIIMKAPKAAQPSAPKLEFILENFERAPDLIKPFSSKLFRKSSLQEFFDIFCKRSGRGLGSVSSLTFAYSWAGDSFEVNYSDGEAVWRDTKEVVKTRFIMARKASKNKKKFQIWVTGPEEDGDW